MFNTSGASYRDGNFKEKIDEMSEKELLAALSKDGKLIKRPLVVGDSVALVGFNEEAYAVKLSSTRRASK
jgi:arsenate reductase